MSTFPFGRIAGMEVRVHVSWTIVLALIVVTVGAQIGTLEPETPAPLRWAIGVAVALGFLLSAVAHELAHALVVVMVARGRLKASPAAAAPAATLERSRP